MQETTNETQEQITRVNEAQAPTWKNKYFIGSMVLLIAVLGISYQVWNNNQTTITQMKSEHEETLATLNARISTTDEKLENTESELDSTQENLAKTEQNLAQSENALAEANELLAAPKVVIEINDASTAAVQSDIGMEISNFDESRYVRPSLHLQGLGDITDEALTSLWWCMEEPTVHNVADAKNEKTLYQYLRFGWGWTPLAQRLGLTDLRVPIVALKLTHEGHDSPNLVSISNMSLVAITAPNGNDYLAWELAGTCAESIDVDTFFPTYWQHWNRDGSGEPEEGEGLEPAELTNTEANTEVEASAETEEAATTEGATTETEGEASVADTTTSVEGQTPTEEVASEEPTPEEDSANLEQESSTEEASAETEATTETEEPTDTRDSYTRGREKFNEGDYRTAHDLFRQDYIETKRVTNLYSMGLCSERMAGRDGNSATQQDSFLSNAMSNYARFLTEAPESHSLREEGSAGLARVQEARRLLRVRRAESNK